MQRAMRQFARKEPNDWIRLSGPESPFFLHQVGPGGRLLCNTMYAYRLQVGATAICLEARLHETPTLI